jgi:hypothetical protein gobsU_14192
VRHLASIQKITRIVPIENADRIELADVLGWHVVVEKGKFSAGDLVVYCKVDSILPDWLKELSGVRDKYLKTRKFRGVYSQGLCLSISALKNENVKAAGFVREGEDVTKALGIKKWDPEESALDRNPRTQATKKWYTKFSPLRWFYKKFLQKKLYADFPSDIVCKTDETRVQVMQDILDKYKGVTCCYTEKLDGSSITFWLENIGRTKKERLRVCSQNKEILDKNNFMYKAAEKLIPRLRNLPERAIFQGEIVGPGIQGNKYELNEHQIFVFQIYDRVYHSFVSMDTMFITCNTHFIDTVPLLGEIALDNSIDDLVKLAEGKSVLNPKIQREGIVVRPLRDIHIPDFAGRFILDRISFKVINPKFLLKYED